MSFAQAWTIVLFCVFWGEFCLGLAISSRQFYATCSSGVQSVLCREISQLSDVRDIKPTGSGVTFVGTDRTGMEALLWLRTSIKLMEKIHDGRVTDANELLKFTSLVPWSESVNSLMTIKCDTILGLDVPNGLRHSHFCSLTVKNAIVDEFRRLGDARPNVELVDPDLSINLYLHRGINFEKYCKNYSCNSGKATLFRVWSGEESMHKRGYHSIVHKASLRETTAAALCVINSFLLLPFLFDFLD
jgi:23S rRNA G2445 N2-methylase RlmL